MALTRAAVAVTHGTPVPRPGFLRLALTLTVIAVGYLGLAWDSLPGPWTW